MKIVKALKTSKLGGRLIKGNYYKVLPSEQYPTCYTVYSLNGVLLHEDVYESCYFTKCFTKPIQLFPLFKVLYGS